MFLDIETARVCQVVSLDSELRLTSRTLDQLGSPTCVLTNNRGDCATQFRFLLIDSRAREADCVRSWLYIEPNPSALLSWLFFSTHRPRYRQSITTYARSALKHTGKPFKI